MNASKAVRVSEEEGGIGTVGEHICCDGVSLCVGGGECVGKKGKCTECANDFIGVFCSDCAESH